MQYRSLDHFISDSKAVLSKGPIALIMVEDAIEIETTLRHHQQLGFAIVVAFMPASFALARDVAESKATQAVFGKHQPISAFKSFTGHTLGACGALEAWVAIEMMRGGATIEDCLRAAIERTADEQELGPEDQVALLALRPDGAWAAMSLRPGFRAVLSSDVEPDLIEPTALWNE